MTNIPLDAAYREACMALGEQIVMERFMSAEIQTLRKKCEELDISGDVEDHESTSNQSVSPR